MWDYKGGSIKQYHCAYSIYLLTCLDLESIVVVRSVGALVHVRYVVGDLNDRDKLIFKF